MLVEIFFILRLLLSSYQQTNGSAKQALLRARSMKQQCASSYQTSHLRHAEDGELKCTTGCSFQLSVNSQSRTILHMARVRLLFDGSLVWLIWHSGMAAMLVALMKASS